MEFCISNRNFYISIILFYWVKVFFKLLYTYLIQFSLKYCIVSMYYKLRYLSMNYNGKFHF